VRRTGPDGWPEAYEYTAGGQTVCFDAEPVPAVRPILHVRLFHPANDHYGMSPIEAAASAIDMDLRPAISSRFG
jgi:phage portal protein BeeE